MKNGLKIISFKYFIQTPALIECAPLKVFNPDSGYLN